MSESEWLIKHGFMGFSEIIGLFVITSCTKDWGTSSSRNSSYLSQPKNSGKRG